jgi:hypothetical protein
MPAALASAVNGGSAMLGIAFAPRARLAALWGVIAVLLAGCGSSSHVARWDGRRGYDGRGDYGYNLNASQGYRAQAARSAYPVPGTPDDPWGPYIRQASQRFGVPERWIREVMRQESGGRVHATSWAGAMGLMQVMPRTWAAMRRRHGLGSDPYEPHQNIMAGTAYLREMHDRYGAPGFLAAYNAGPERMDAVLSGAMILPEETLNYVASIAPRLGMQATTGGRFATYAGGSSYRSAAPSGGDLAYAGGGMTGAEYHGDPSRRAFDGGGLVTPDAPTGILTPRY